MGVFSGMTGFARAQTSGEYGVLTIEIRSVNGKGLDIRTRLPSGFDRLEISIKEKLKSRFSRGSIQLSLSYEPVQTTQNFHIDTQVLEACVSAAKALVDEGIANPASAGELLGLKGVITTNDTQPVEDLEAVHCDILSLVDMVVDDLLNTRQAEGQALGLILQDHLVDVEHLCEAVSKSAEILPETIRDRIKTKFDELLPSGLNPDKLEQEAALLAVKADIREELDRLLTHIESARALIAKGSPCGRKLDFLAQEFNRETNTLCSKSADPALTRIGLDMKVAIDRFREQVQNVE